MGKSKKEPSVKKKVNGYNPIHIKEGEILKDISGNHWKIGKSVGSGGFGEIYLTSDDISKPVSQDALYAAKIEPHKNGPLFVEMNFYIRVGKKEIIDQWKKDKGLKHLGMPYYITFGSHFYQNEKFRFLILQRFGQDLGKLFNKCKRKFHIKTVLTLGVQILDILEYIHSHGYIHADIKDSNLLLGTGKDDECVYLLDYGLACRYIDSLGEHKEYNPDQRKAHDGTLQYTSRDAHVGAHSRRSDLETLAYNMLHWLCGWLPWEDEISDPEKVAQKKETYMTNIPSLLKECFGDCPPAVLSHFLKYVVSLSFEAKPDYEYCKTLLRQGIRQAGYADDGKLNFSTPPAKLKSRKRIRNFDIENLVELKPLKMPRNTPRQPCVPVQANCNRITRQQTAANVPALRSREAFDWVKVLQSDPEKILKSQSATNDQVKKRKIVKCKKERQKSPNIEISLKKEKENPLENPTPAMCEILKLRNSSAPANPGRRTRSESQCSSPVFYENSTLTPAMEEVIRRRERASKHVEHSSDYTRVLATTLRSNRLKAKTETTTTTPPKAEHKKLPQFKRITRKTSVPETKTPDMTEARKKTRKYSLEEQKLTTEHNLYLGRKRNLRKETPRRVRKTRKPLQTMAKSITKKSLGFSKKRSFRRREVSPSEIDFVPRLRSGFDTSDDYYYYYYEKPQLVSGVSHKMRNYAANSGPQIRGRRCGISYSGLPPTALDSSMIV